MAAPKRTKLQREQDRATIAALYLKGWTQAAIGQRIGIAQQNVCRELKLIRAAWLESSLVDFNAKKAEELARLDRIEAEAWEAWEASKVIEDVALGPGDPRYLAQVERCVLDRVKIMGLAAPEVTEATLTIRRPYVDLTDEELLALGAKEAADGAAGR